MRIAAKRSSRGIIGLAMLAALSACVTATPYQPYQPPLTAGVHGGYSDRQLAPNRYLVRFHGNELASRDRVEGYMLYRAAELTVQNGYDWFMIVDRHTEHDVQTYARPDALFRPWYGSAYEYWRPHWRFYRQGYGWDVWHPELGGPFWSNGIDVQTVESFEAEAEIVLYKGMPAALQERTFDARKVMTDLGPSIILPKQK